MHTHGELVEHAVVLLASEKYRLENPNQQYGGYDEELHSDTP